MALLSPCSWEASPSPHPVRARQGRAAWRAAVGRSLAAIRRACGSSASASPARLCRVFACRCSFFVPRSTPDERSLYVLSMGGKEPNRQPRVGSVRETPPGWIRLVTCNACAHRGVLPAEMLLKKYGELELLEFALVGLRCTHCRSWGATMTMVRLCDAACPRIRQR